MKDNNGDMDDLFRRASDKYPLRTDSADWDRLANALDEPVLPSDGEDKRRKRRGVFWWFLLVPLAGIGYLTLQVRAHRSVSNGNIATVQQVPKSAGDGRQSQNPGSGGEEVRKMRNPDSNSTAGAGHGRGLRQVDGQFGNGVRGQQGGGESPVEGVRGLRAGNETASSAPKVVKMRSRQNGPENGPQNSPENSRQNGPEKRIPGGSVNTTASVNIAGSVDDAGSGSMSGSGVAGGAGAAGHGVAGGIDHSLVLAALDLRRAPIAGGYNVVVDVKAPVRTADSTPARKPAKRNSHVYIGLSGAPDLSTVKFQSMKGVGATFGLLLGYSFNDRWAVETGLYLDRKRYYTDGEYFKDERLPSTDKLLNVDGTCYMWEIPLNVRYNFSTNPRMKWFATAGLSTYLMSSEKYAYQAEYTSGTPTWAGSWNIHNPSQYWFSIVNLSAGFEERLGKIGNLRLEPYIRLPLSGIGTGKLPIMSAGLNIGITRQLW